MVEQLIINGIIAGGIYSIMAIGFAYIYQNTRFFHGLRVLLRGGGHFDPRVTKHG